jgi:hypothetical protein
LAFGPLINVPSAPTSISPPFASSASYTYSGGATGTSRPLVPFFSIFARTSDFSTSRTPLGPAAFRMTAAAASGTSFSSTIVATSSTVPSSATSISPRPALNSTS